ncbi:glycosyltransferase family 2 protein [Nocardioides hwasunensis]|uniref:Glycosyltransferase family 2 protein n=1 Tax=Nocardioides hwasunensis TaxID=397258 RepID=A0ABR8MMC5_9ACTN|nr:glycosyltransferase family 2 protein [Nocardioides hwasunensis]MBD3915229.1 glycosyltransferase family 2 protein [Nocardioides hwasunensis]
MTERVAVVVVTYNSADVVPGLVASLDAGLGEVPWDLVVADNASADHTLAVLARTAPDATLLALADNRGYAAGINAAVAAAPPHSAVLVLNPDVRLEPGCVAELLAVMRRTGAGVVVPRLQDATGELIHSMRRTPTVLRGLGDAVLGAVRAGRYPLLGELVTDPGAYALEQDVDWAEGSTQLVDAGCWLACGEWDEGYFLYSEETEFHLRAGDRGFAVRYVPSAAAVHLEGGSATSTRLWPLLVANRWRLYRARHGAVRSAAFWTALLARESSRALLGRETCRLATRVLLRPDLLRGPRGPEWLDAVSAGA